MHIDRNQLPNAPSYPERKKMVARFMEFDTDKTEEAEKMAVIAILDGYMIFEAETDLLRLTKEGYDAEMKGSRRQRRH